MTTTQTDRIDGTSTSSGPGTDLAAIEALSGTGFPARTASNTWALRTLTPPAAGIAITNPAGGSGDPTLALANDLAGLEGVSGTGIASRTGTDTWALRNLAVSGTGLVVTNPAGVAGDYTITITPSTVVGAAAAAQSDQETGTSVVLAVTPGRQQYHPSASKFWAYVTVSAGTPTLAASYNVTSITDTGTGLLTITIGTDFSSTSWCCDVSVERAATALTVANARDCNVRFGGIAAGTVLVECMDKTATTANQVDPASWHVIGYGDQ